MGVDYYLVNEEHKVCCYLYRGYILHPHASQYSNIEPITQKLIRKSLVAYIEDCHDDDTEYFERTIERYLELMTWLRDKAHMQARCVTEDEYADLTDSEVYEELDLFHDL